MAFIRCPSHQLQEPPVPLDGYDLLDIRRTGDATTDGRKLDDMALPPGAIPTAITKGRRTSAIDDDSTLHTGDHLLVLVPASRPEPSGDGT